MSDNENISFKFSIPVSPPLTSKGSHINSTQTQRPYSKNESVQRRESTNNMIESESRQISAEFSKDIHANAIISSNTRLSVNPNLLDERQQGIAVKAEGSLSLVVQNHDNVSYEMSGSKRLRLHEHSQRSNSISHIVTTTSSLSETSTYNQRSSSSNDINYSYTCFKSSELIESRPDTVSYRDNVVSASNADDVEYAAPLSLSHPSQTTGKERGLGAWYFNKKARKRCYVSLTGQVLSGFEAFAKCREDKDSLLHPSKSLRAELRYLMLMTPQTVDDFKEAMTTTFSKTSFTRQLLSTWGLPSAVINMYQKRKIDKLFDWQIECLLLGDGAPLRGRDLIYSAPTSGKSQRKLLFYSLAKDTMSIINS